MEWLIGMQGCEAQLKVIIDRLAMTKDKGLSARTERAYLRMLLRARLVAMRSSLGKIGARLPDGALDAFEWQVKVGLPLFSHLEAVIALTDEAALGVSAA